MVTRKPVPPAGLAPNSTAPPYPTTPIATNNPPSFRMQDARKQLQSPEESEPDEENEWDDEEVVDEQAGINKPLPELLRAGPPGYTPNASQEMLRPIPASTNPYLQRQNSGGQSESSADAWGGFAERPAPPSGAPPPPPIPDGMNASPVCDLHADKIDASSSVHKLSNLSLNEPSGNPWQPALDQASQASQSSKASSLRRQDSGNAAWAAPAPARLAPPVPPIEISNPDLIDVEAPESPAWDEEDEDEDEAEPIVHETPAEDTPEVQQMNEDRHAWDESAGQSLHPIPAADEPVGHADPIPAGEGWNLVDHEPSGAQESGVVGYGGAVELGARPAGGTGFLVTILI